MSTVEASKLQRSFGFWHDQLHRGPVEITKYGRTTGFLVSADLFREMQLHYRKVTEVANLSNHEMGLIEGASVETDTPYNLSDIPDIDEG